MALGGLDEAIGGDGSDEDLLEIAMEAADEAIAEVYSNCTNPGMEELAAMIEDAIYTVAEDMAAMQGPSSESLYGAIAGVHSEDTAYSCMSAGIEAAMGVLEDAWDEIEGHEAEEGNG
jgi:hypothetical protein